MDVKKACVKDIFNGEKHMIIPLFQRPYTWQKKDWETMWNDVHEQYRHSKEKDTFSGSSYHFIGTIVTIPVPNDASINVNRQSVIDGQQRITTFSLMFQALYVLANRQKKDKQLVNRIRKHIINEDESEKELTRYKLLPTQKDREAYFSVINYDENTAGGDGEKVSSNLFRDAVSFFVGKLEEGAACDEEDENHINVADFFNTVLQQISLVLVTLEANDDPYLIFESLNAKGQALTQADLIRNYILLRFKNTERQEYVYKNYWIAIENIIDYQNINEIFMLYSAINGVSINKNHVYGYIKKRFDQKNEREVLAEMEILLKSAQIYALLCNKECKIENISPQLQERFAHFRAWQNTTVYPLIIKLTLRVLSKDISEKVFLQILDILDSFLVRRTICDIASNKLRSIFLSLASESDRYQNSDIVEWMGQKLASMNHRLGWPNKEQFIKGLLSRSIYSDKERCKAFLVKLERSYQHKETVTLDTLTIEHIMPQSAEKEVDQKNFLPNATDVLSDEVKLYLSESQIAEMQNNVFLVMHLLGNLTLTGYNSELGAKTFEEKKEQYKNSHIEITKNLCNYEAWNVYTILERTLALAKVAARVWVEPPEPPAKK